MAHLAAVEAAQTQRIGLVDSRVVCRSIPEVSQSSQIDRLFCIGTRTHDIFFCVVLHLTIPACLPVMVDVACSLAFACHIGTWRTSSSIRRTAGSYGRNGVCGTRRVIPSSNSVQPTCAKYSAVVSTNEMPVITFVTGNQNKLREVAAILEARQDAKDSFKLVARKLDLPELQGDPEDIARQKCAIAAKVVNGPVVRSEQILHPHFPLYPYRN